MNRYRVKNKITGELAEVSHMTVEHACRELTWDPSNCWVVRLRPTKGWDPIKRYIAPNIKSN